MRSTDEGAGCGDVPRGTSEAAAGAPGNFSSDFAEGLGRVGGRTAAERWAMRKARAAGGWDRVTGRTGGETGGGLVTSDGE